MFTLPEREFLRLALSATPDFSAMTQIARTALSYGELRQLAGLHQLDGVVAWRLLDERMDGVAPNIVREDCQRYLDHLDGANADYWQQVGYVCNQLREADLRFVVVSGPVQYLPLGMPHFPRRWNDIDICLEARPEDFSRVAKLLGDAAATQVEPLYWAMTLQSGLNVEITAGHADESDQRGFYPLLKAPQEVEWQGLTMPIPDGASWVACLACRSWLSVAQLCAPLPLWALARLAAWEPLTTAAAVGDMLAGYAIPEWPPWPGVQGHTSAHRSLWFLEMADSIYGTTFGAQARAQWGLVGVPPVIAPETVHSWDEERAKAAGNPEVLLARQWVYRQAKWAERSPEEMLFAMPKGFAARVDAGFWTDVRADAVTACFLDGRATTYMEDVADA